MIASVISGLGLRLPKLRLITVGQCCAAVSMPTAALKLTMLLTGLASQISSAACGYTPTMPTPLAAAAATDATNVPCHSSGPNVVWSFSSVTLGRPTNSGVVTSRPLSMIASGTPGPGGVAWSAPMSCSHHSCAWSGSSVIRPVAAAAVPARPRAANVAASAMARRDPTRRQRSGSLAR